MIRKLLKKLLLWALKEDAKKPIWDGRESKIDRKLLVYVGEVVTPLAAERVSGIGLICSDGQGKERLVMPYDAYSRSNFDRLWRTLGGKSAVTWPDGTPYDGSEQF